ncbi:tetratricopeptide repeat protein [Streptomyces sp. NPDC057386]|uniref:tetratricopeptide repeat protein n=1 Tax=unclassified Streptomyces TaxID=2593676 RepID=UPI003626EDE6
MSRLSREQRENTPEPGGTAAPPLDVHVPAPGPDTGRASISGVPVVPADGEELQQAVLRHLYGIARSTGRPVYATVRDHRIGFAVPLRVDPDGSSRLTGEPVAMPGGDEVAEGGVPEAPAPGAPEAGVREVLVPGVSVAPEAPVPGVPVAPEAPAPGVPVAPEAPVPGVSEAAVQGSFGPPPVMPASGSAAEAEPEAAEGAVPTRTPAAGPAAAPAPVPPRFDVVAEAILGGEPTVGAGMPALLAEQVEKINEAVRSGRVAEASELADNTLNEAVRVLGAEHADVLRLRELSAYVAYLDGNPLRSFRLSLAVARVHHRARDAGAAYGNVQSAATAWRAVRDPLQGLDLGRELIGLWEELAAGDGPAAADIEELDSARARMTRLTGRAAARSAGGEDGGRD